MVEKLIKAWVLFFKKLFLISNYDMKKNVFVLFGLLFANNLFAQNGAISVTSTPSGETVLIMARKKAKHLASLC
jgi:hypothetical protein